MAFPQFTNPYGVSTAFRNYAQPYGVGSRRIRVRRRMGLVGLGAVPALPSRWMPGSGGSVGPIFYNGPMPWSCPPNAMCAPPLAPTAPSGPVPAGFPTNQLFIAPDGSQWAYSAAQGQWINVGTPYNLSAASNPPPASTSIPTQTSTPTPPVSVNVAPAPTTSPYDTVINFATGDSLITGIPNWLVGVGLVFGYKLISSKMGSRR